MTLRMHVKPGWTDESTARTSPVLALLITLMLLGLLLSDRLHDLTSRSRLATISCRFRGILDANGRYYELCCTRSQFRRKMNSLPVEDIACGVLGICLLVGPWKTRMPYYISFIHLLRGEIAAPVAVLVLYI